MISINIQCNQSKITLLCSSFTLFFLLECYLYIKIIVGWFIFQGYPNLEDHVLWIDAFTYTPLDENNIPTGENLPPKKNPLTFCRPLSYHKLVISITNNITASVFIGKSIHTEVKENILCCCFKSTFVIYRRSLLTLLLPLDSFRNTRCLCFHELN